ncbi:hypothetical protein MRAB57_1465 [Mycobacterium rhizamassiliense]|jgi:hypothetical protein|uniref:Uncharacterized protein n=1 Tax=Mycobacterium rhizamassiliense TaxID=1841860 RepID=A0A2U3NQ78_9MYCO|nr:hypothetical protein [Mycobacterium rhizamassiliense]SPM33661.1 hypothetical protein MRAB57_1465 [Mycobacterium rhizamassiliense]
MPGELLRYLGAPAGFAWWWWLVAGVCAAVVVAWYSAVYAWTLPPARLRRVPVIRTVHSWLVRRRFRATVTKITDQYRAGQLSDGQAAAAIRRTLRSFLSVTTGNRVQYMHIDDIVGQPELAPTAPVFTALNDAQFSTERTDFARVAHAASEVIRTWT